MVAGDLFWWRETATIHTHISIYWFDYDMEAVRFTFALFDSNGALAAQWEQIVKPWDIIMVDSAAQPDIPTVPDGLLAIIAAPVGEASERFKTYCERLYGIIDCIRMKAKS